MNVAARLEVVQPIRRVLRWLLSLRDDEGHIVCPVHRIEHTGKNAGVIVIACELAKHADDVKCHMAASTLADIEKCPSAGKVTFLKEW